MSDLPSVPGPVTITLTGEQFERLRTGVRPPEPSFPRWYSFVTSIVTFAGQQLLEHYWGIPTFVSIILFGVGLCFLAWSLIPDQYRVKKAWAVLLMLFATACWASLDIGANYIRTPESDPSRPVLLGTRGTITTEEKGAITSFTPKVNIENIGPQPAYDVEFMWAMSLLGSYASVESGDLKIVKPIPGGAKKEVALGIVEASCKTPGTLPSNYCQIGSLAIFLKLKYRGGAANRSYLNEEYWYTYRLNGTGGLADAEPSQKAEFEPHARKAVEKYN